MKKLKLSEIANYFGRFLSSQILGVRAPQPLYPSYHACPVVRHMEKFREVTSLNPKVIGAHMLNFGLIFKFIIVKNCWGTPVFGKCTLASLGHSQPCNNLREQHSFKKMILGA